MTTSNGFTVKKRRASDDSMNMQYSSYMSTDKKVKTQQDWFSNQFDPIKANCQPFGGQIYNTLLSSDDHPNVNPRKVLMQSHVQDTFNYIQSNNGQKQQQLQNPSETVEGQEVLQPLSPDHRIVVPINQRPSTAGTPVTQLQNTALYTPSTDGRNFMTMKRPYMTRTRSIGNKVGMQSKQRILKDAMKDRRRSAAAQGNYGQSPKILTSNPVIQINSDQVMAVNEQLPTDSNIALAHDRILS